MVNEISFGVLFTVEQYDLKLKSCCLSLNKI